MIKSKFHVKNKISLYADYITISSNKDYDVSVKEYHNLVHYLAWISKSVEYSGMDTATYHIPNADLFNAAVDTLKVKGFTVVR